MPGRRLAIYAPVAALAALAGCTVITDFGAFLIESGPEPCEVASDCSDDGLSCTEEVCQSGVCGSEPRHDRCASPASLPCLERACAPELPWAEEDGCAFRPLPRGAPCDEVYFCTLGDECDGQGGCVPGREEGACDDGAACTQDQCLEAERRCEPIPLHDRCPGARRWCAPGEPGADPDGCVQPSRCTFRAECDDGNPCNGSESCDGIVGRCAPATEVPACLSPTECFASLCVNDSGCRTDARPSRCVDGDPCTVDRCELRVGCSGAPPACSLAYPDGCCPAECDDETDADCMEY